tara:strand:- start:4685 stop:4888 length:204 start_codon:yes stop_codon:yes gene_type:complete
MAFKMKGFKPHDMYDKKKANTAKQHSDLKEKGYGHSPLKKDDPCWESHKMVGTKKKGGRTVPNCVPK